MNVVHAPRALRDLQGIGAYLLERSPAGAGNVLAAIRSSINTLSYFPEIGTLVDGAGHRRMSVPRYPYVVFYRLMGLIFWSFTLGTHHADQSIP